MDDFVEIPASAVLEESKREFPDSPDHFVIPYIIYFSPDDPRRKIRINTYYLPQGDSIRLCPYYDRGLCDTEEEFRRLPRGYVEEAAYGAWMDGAR